MKIELDEKGFPKLIGDKLDLAVGPGTGNPNHGPGGKFGEGASLNVVVGKEVVNQLDPSQVKIIADRAQYASANAVGAKANSDGSVQVVLFKNATKMDEFTVNSPGEAGSQAPGSTAQPLPKPLAAHKDKIVQAARNLSLKGGKLNSWAQDNTPEINPQDIHAHVNSQRVDDLVHYLNQSLSQKINSNKLSNTVRIRMPRGFLRQSFANVDKPMLDEILLRLSKLGWSEQQLQDNIVAGLPKRLRDEISKPTEPSKSSSGKASTSNN